MSNKMIDNVNIRLFNPEKDYNEALMCFNEGFYHTLWPFIDHASQKFILDCLKIFYLVSSHPLVAEIDNEVHCLLFGSAPVSLLKYLKGLFFFIFIMLPKLILNIYKMNFLAYKHLIQCFAGYSPFAVFQPASLKISEIMLFTSRKKYRHRGLGRKLMDSFVKIAAEKNIKSAYVCTDTALSYKFYEGYGFRISKKFKMIAYKYSIPETAFSGLLYSYDLKNHNKQI